MIDTIYIEDAVKTHPRTKAICKQYPEATLIRCERFGALLNPNQQNFRLQKLRPALILASKFDHHVLKAPLEYNIGSEHNYYFSHMLNCLFDCRYCFLQGFYRSAHYVVFVNDDDFKQAMEDVLKRIKDEDVYFFSGYDCDSLAFDKMTGFVDTYLPFFETRPHAYLELRTKSVNVKSLLKRQPIPNAVIAFSMSPESVQTCLEAGTPSIEKRVKALKRLGEAGWKLGLRLDPMIYYQSYKVEFEALLASIFKDVKPEYLHSVSLGAFRLPKGVYERMYRLYPDEKLFAGGLEASGGMVSYGPNVEEEMLSFCAKKLLQYIPEDIFFPCRSVIK